jgi:hypothetical protein
MVCVKLVLQFSITGGLRGLLGDPSLPPLLAVRERTRLLDFGFLLPPEATPRNPLCLLGGDAVVIIRDDRSHHSAIAGDTSAKSIST